MTAIESASRRAALSLLSRMRGGFVELVEPDGRRFLFGDPGSDLAIRLEVRSPAFYRSLLGGSVGLGESYRDGHWDCATSSP
jgi:cyclopropane-fatty-acyl-phospholipid synthase